MALAAEGRPERAQEVNIKSPTQKRRRILTRTDMSCFAYPPHAGRPGGGRSRPRPVRLHELDGGRRGQARVYPRSHRRARLLCGRGPDARTRPARATIVHLPGLDHDSLTSTVAGITGSPEVHGHVAQKIIG